MDKKEIWRNIFTVSNILSPEECNHYIELTENIGYDQATVSTAAGPVLSTGIRNNTRVMLDDEKLASELWEKIKTFASPVRFYKPVGLNERFRFYRYDPGEKFAPHSDGCFQHEDGRKSFYTFMIYLNDGFDGGETTFFVVDYEEEGFVKKSIPVYPEKGTALFFEHSIIHEGSILKHGRKYVLRTDVMYQLEK